MKTWYLSNNVFKRELRNGECVKCEWQLYSPFQGRLYCFVCRLLSKKESSFATLGFNDCYNFFLFKINVLYLLFQIFLVCLFVMYIIV